MKFPALISLLVPFSAFAQAEKPGPVAGSEKALAWPLRKFDGNRDGLLTGDELRLARQAHNRGGRDAEPTESRWRDLLGRLEKDFMRRRSREFDVNSNGKMDGPEQDEMRKVWRTIAGRVTGVRNEITLKYDRNDDGELNDPERNASRAESERRRREEEDKAIEEWRAARPDKTDPAKTGAA